NIEKPKMAPHIDQMRRNIAEHLHCDESRINVKATRGEGLGFVGRGEGAIAYAVCLIDEKR
ncbi:MAG: 2-C-methyl-D-erythritol 2,4-cyclodiphosphate synthase, partial [Erysipelotrichaceae bacterium]|nr:2-C-methyl-D-erythritol 2,4-cyclodiphosphate synthase [Erysipelotrichaceae bacterium]